MTGVLVSIGAILTAAGLAGLGYCILRGFRIRGGSLAPEEARAELHRLIAVNLGSVALAALGLALVVAGLFL